MDESCHANECVTSRVIESRDVRTRHTTHMNESCHIGMMKESWDIWMSHVTYE